MLAQRGLFGSALREVSHMDAVRLMHGNEEWAHKKAEAVERNMNFDVNQVMTEAEQHASETTNPG